ncbi:hypothetical protein HPB52_020008 [Rhipicephalus sanguineus]|uniref:Ubiquitin-conjugating enzyme E2 Z n=1 Tax=Rhipicephalus sanguineus TaxID=34632 RepID=A0A9D4SQW3_RHISA|nr:hypothetical protein HPB52_020008 [Rhipicephalus sanguineus]
MPTPPPPPCGIFIAPDDVDITKISALLIGPTGTPYENGFFLFFMKIPSAYPEIPPLVRTVTTDNGNVAFNPILYASGKVCLSILGTWMGPAWSPALTIEGILVSIQSMLNDYP